MKLSYNWLKELTGTKSTPEQLGETLTMLGFELEELIDYNKIYDKFITARVIKKESHPDADKLSLCTVEYNNNSQVVVCGAPNVDANQTIILGLEGAVVPSAGFALSKRKIRGIESNGMICSKAELELGEDHDGIWILPHDAPIGIPLAEYIKMDDVMIDVFITPNRADGASHIGIAREICAAEGLKLKIPEIEIDTDESNLPEVKITIEDVENCPRYTALILDNIKVVESPDWLKNRLKVIGLRPRNLIVDATNYVMMECGNPLHAFDLSKVAGKEIIVKAGENGYNFKSLDEKDRKLDNTMLTINDAEKPVAIAGVMGGYNSEIDNNSTSILIESAYFNSSSVRRTSRKLSLQSDSSYRYERGVDVNNLEYAARRCADLIIKYGSGNISSQYSDSYPNKKEIKPIEVRFDRVRKIIGIELNNSEIIELCSKLNWQIEINNNQFIVNPPSYRVDLIEEIDIVEEVARLYNFDNIKPDYTSQIDFSGNSLPITLSMPKLRNNIKEFLISNGFIETISQNQTDKLSNDLFSENSIEISNPLGQELGFMRNNLINSILKIVKRNQNLKNQDLQIFQIGKVFLSDNSNGFIERLSEQERICIALTGKSEDENWHSNNRSYDFYDIKGQTENLLENLRLTGLKFKNNNSLDIFSAQSQNVFIGKKQIGTIGSISKKLKKYFDIDYDVWVIDIDLSSIYNLTIKEAKYQKVSSYPNVERDFAFLINEDVVANKILNLVEQNAGKLYKDSYIFDIYQGKGIEQGKKSIAIKVILGSEERTLNEQEINESSNKILKALETKLGAKLRD
jgi:phenylalanyl-tRNA synthetase beta chain